MAKRRRTQEEDLQEVLYSSTPTQRRRKKVQAKATAVDVGSWTKFLAKNAAHLGRILAMIWFCVSISDFGVVLPSYLMLEPPANEDTLDGVNIAAVKRNSERLAIHAAQRTVLKQSWLTSLSHAVVSIVIASASGCLLIFIRQQK